ncbi:MAG TPA: hypothetical protein GXZ74_08840 [Tissierellia bacterium]|nr:hypothetical protein [Tissierellia bacterium]
MRDDYRAGMDAIGIEQAFQSRLIERLLQEVDRQENKSPKQAWLAIGLGVSALIALLVWLLGSGED